MGTNPNDVKLHNKKDRHNAGVKKPTEVHVRMIVMKVGDINSSQESFSGDIIIQSRWRDPSLDHYTDHEISVLDYSKIWKPSMKVDNMLTESKDQSAYSVEFFPSAEFTSGIKANKHNNNKNNSYNNKNNSYNNKYNSYNNNCNNKNNSYNNNYNNKNVSSNKNFRNKNSNSYNNAKSSSNKNKNKIRNKNYNSNNKDNNKQKPKVNNDKIPKGSSYGESTPNGAPIKTPPPNEPQPQKGSQGGEEDFDDDDYSDGDEEDEEEEDVEIRSERVAFVNYQWKIKGTFYENLELEEFPFDIQDLSFTIIANNPLEEVILVEDVENVSFVRLNSFVKAQEWKLSPSIVVETGIIKDMAIPGKSLGKSFSLIHFKCCVERRFMYFIYNVTTILTFITLLSFIPFSLDLKISQSRIQLSLLLLLTTLTFKTNVSNLLPKIPYLTLLDKYILSCWCLQCLQTAWHGLVCVFVRGLPSENKIDKMAFFCFFVCYLFIQIFFISVMIGKARKTNIAVKKKSSVKTPNALKENREQWN